MMKRNSAQSDNPN